MTDAPHTAPSRGLSIARSVTALVFAVAALAGSLMLAQAASYGWGAMSAAALGGLAVIICVPISLLVTLVAWLLAGRLSRLLQAALAVNGLALALLLANIP